MGKAAALHVPRLAVDVWSDILCPWCAIGLAQFRKALDQIKGEIDVEVRFMPFELDPHLPQEGADYIPYLARRLECGQNEIEQMRARLAEMGEDAGFSFAYDGEGIAPPLMVWNTFEAHKLLRWALTKQGMDAQMALKLALFRAHFQQRRNIASRDVLLDIAENLGFDRPEMADAMQDEALAIAVRLEQERGQQARIASVPTFVINGQYVAPGAHQPETHVQMLRKVAQMAR